jgi:hypothetical protein
VAAARAAPWGRLETVQKAHTGRPRQRVLSRLMLDSDLGSDLGTGAPHAPTVRPHGAPMDQEDQEDGGLFWRVAGWHPVGRRLDRWAGSDTAVVRKSGKGWRQCQ